MPPRRTKRTVLSSKKRLADLSSAQKITVMKALGASPESIKMAIELNKKISILRKRDPGLCGAFGLGCGGVTC